MRSFDEIMYEPEREMDGLGRAVTRECGRRLDTNEAAGTAQDLKIVRPDTRERGTTR
jgi:hypothetical protein